MEVEGLSIEIGVVGEDEVVEEDRRMAVDDDGGGEVPVLLFFLLRFVIAGLAFVADCVIPRRHLKLICLK